MANSDGNDDNVVSPKIVDAVDKSTKYAFGVPVPTSNTSSTTPTYNAGQAIAFEKVAQACAYQVQDATDYQRNILSVNSAAQGKALALMFKDVESGKGEKLAEHAIIFVLAIMGSIAASATAEFIGTAAGKVLKDFPTN